MFYDYYTDFFYPFDFEMHHWSGRIKQAFIYVQYSTLPKLESSRRLTFLPK